VVFTRSIIKSCDIVLASNITWPNDYLIKLSHEEQVAIANTDAFFVTDVSQDGIVELEYVKKSLTYGWCYIHKNQIQSDIS
jgi:hypothetical protein